jgi:pimeloyl-ACP methyl ester carboxylesterase
MPAPFGSAHLLEAGSGDSLLLLHGGSVVAQWAPLISRLATRFHLLMPDKPGAGLASPFNYRGVDLRAHAVAFIEGLLDALGVQRAAVGGNSMGGYFALCFALAHPERVTKLAIVGEPAGADPQPTRQQSRYHRLVGTRGLNAFLFKTALKPKTGAEGARTGLARGKLVADPNRVPAELLECMAAGWQLPGAVRSWYTMVERAWDPPGAGLFAGSTILTNRLADELAGLNVPTLFLWGEKDPLGSPDVGRALADRMPDARLEVVPDASHLVHVDQPKICADAIMQFAS